MKKKYKLLSSIWIDGGLVSANRKEVWEGKDMTLQVIDPPVYVELEDDDTGIPQMIKDGTIEAVAEKKPAKKEAADE